VSQGSEKKTGDSLFGVFLLDIKNHYQKYQLDNKSQKPLGKPAGKIERAVGYPETENKLADENPGRPENENDETGFGKKASLAVHEQPQNKNHAAADFDNPEKNLESQIGVGKGKNAFLDIGKKTEQTEDA
jgi:hypothetical protein